MQMNRLRFAPVFFLFTAACAGFPLFWKKEAPRAESGRTEFAPPDPGPARATLEFQSVQYDGESLTGRLLLGTESGVVRLDKRLVPRSDIQVNAVFECSSGAPVAFIMADVIPPSAQQEDLLTLTPGYWYGTTARFKLFSERFTGQGPACIEAEFTVFSFEGRPLANKRVRAERLATDGTVLDALSSSSDAGTP